MPNRFSNDTYGAHSHQEEMLGQEVILQHHGYLRFNYGNNNDTRIRITINLC